MITAIIWSIIFIFSFVLFKSVVLSYILFFSVIPDIALLILLFVSLANGSLSGVIIGFFAGLIVDTISIAPLGLHAFTYAVIGFIAGKFFGRYNMNNAFFLIITAFFALLLKALLFFLLSIVFGSNIRPYNLAEFVFWFELIATLIAAPFIFWFLRLFPQIFFSKKQDF